MKNRGTVAKSVVTQQALSSLPSEACYSICFGLWGFFNGNEKTMQFLK